MATQSASTPHANAGRPGNFDVLHTLQVFPSDNAFGIPTVPHAPLSYTPDQLVGYQTAANSDRSSAALHFFQADFRFERVWSRPQQTRRTLNHYRTLLTPDFSLYTDWPLAAQLWNVYRSRWCGALWVSWGFQVIPTVSWSTPASYPFCFAGLPKYSLVAVSTVGVVRQNTAWALFEQGYREMLRQVRPSRILCYGRVEQLGSLASLADTRCFAPDEYFVSE